MTKKIVAPEIGSTKETIEDLTALEEFGSKTATGERTPFAKRLTADDVKAVPPLFTYSFLFYRLTFSLIA